MGELNKIRYTRSERRAVGLLAGLILSINLGSFVLGKYAEPDVSFMLSDNTSIESTISTINISPEPVLKIEINSADSISLLALYGIGPYFSQRIIKYRNLLGGYYSTSQLLEVYGMDSIRYLGFSHDTRVDTNLVQKINLVTVVFRDLLRHPYIQYEMVKSFIQIRDRHGPPDDYEELWREASWPDSLKDCLTPYLSLAK